MRPPLWDRIDDVALAFLVLLALLVALMTLSSCARAAAPQVVERVVVRVVKERCGPTSRPALERVPRPYFCLPGRPCPKCLPDEVCLDKADGARLAGNLERLVAWVDEAFRMCAKAAP